ncbi:MAG: hypothetical protein ACT4NP_04215 [Pseudonocardiales bacterium]
MMAGSVPVKPGYRGGATGFRRATRASDHCLGPILDAVLARMAAEDGEPSERDLAWVQRVLAR